jgi:4-aminobutyrate aminotransferase/(S)-3-amino-2-methylpropionate transaminase
VPRLTPLAVDSGSGAWLEDEEGRRILDFATGIGVMGLGHSHPQVVRAIQEQAARLQHVCMHVASYEPYVAVCEALARLVPHGEHTKVLLVNSGAEAVENAVKIARQATGRPAVLCFTGGFHGRTLLGMSLTSKVGYKRGCGPFAPEVYRLPFPDHRAWASSTDPDAFVDQELRRLDEALVDRVAPEHLAAILIEVVQGEGGIVPCPGRYLRGLRERCDRHGILLILDEIQCGLGRTGRWGAYEHHGVVPDLSTWAKALGGGLPLAAVVGRAEVMDAAAPGTLGGTYGGNPVACAAALATLRVMEEEDLSSRAEAIGTEIRDRLEPLREECALVAEVRGLGAMMAVVLEEDGQPAAEAARAVADRCLSDGLLVITAGVTGNAVRLLPPLTISDIALERGLDVLTTAIREVGRTS